MIVHIENPKKSTKKTTNQTNKKPQSDFSKTTGYKANTQESVDPGTVAHACNPSYSGSRDQGDHG
jgi:hypothetical protein